MQSFIDSDFFSVLYPFVLILTVIIGYYTAEIFYNRKNKQWHPSGVESAVIGFFALIIAFTFSSSNSEFRNRINHIHEESDLIAQTYRTSLQLDSPTKDETIKYLSAFIDAHLAFNHYKSSEEGLVNTVNNINESFQNYLAQQKDSASQKQDAYKKLLQNYDQLNSVFYRNAYSFKERTPLTIMLLLIVSSWMIGVLVGFMSAFYLSRHFLVPAIFILLVTFTMHTIRDLDNPRKGSIKPSFENLETLKLTINKILK